ncbi:MAG: cache domain-containing protein, partial [Ktedonobacteraceae bacterium]|nr:cache domain-containing protein [Ktedonobacteraceae bacterium]
MLHFLHRSLLIQLLSVYLLFVVIVLLGGVGVNEVVAQQLKNDVQASDQALAQEIALQTDLQLLDAENSLVRLGNIVQQAGTPGTIANAFHTFKDARSDVDQVYWLGPVGDIRVSWPLNNVALGAEFSPPDVVQQALISTGPVFEVGIAVETTFHPGVILADPVRTSGGQLLGIVAASLSLAELSDPLATVAHAQQGQHRRLIISIIDDRGELIATPDSRRIMEKMLDELPGADQALHGLPASSLGLG